MAGQAADPNPTTGAPAAGPSAAPPVAAASAGPAELVTRPEPGLARGVWEAPPWAFWATLGFVVLASTLYLLHRAGVIGGKHASSRGPST